MRLNTNTYVVENEIVKILTIKNEMILVDSNDFEIVKRHCWHVDSKGYAAAGKNGKKFRMHTLLMNTPSGYQVDHINRNRLDNRKSNLRIVTNQENHFNEGLSKSNKSGVKGVYWHKECKKWCCQITLNGKCIYSELFVNLEDAVKKRKELENKYHKIKGE